MAKRLRHSPAVWAQTPSLAAISLLVRPPAAARTMRARTASDCGAPCLRIRDVSACFSASSRTISTARPFAIPASSAHRPQREYNLFADQDTSAFDLGKGAPPLDRGHGDLRLWAPMSAIA